MKFIIKKIIIWPKKPNLNPKEIEFFHDKLNIITGVSRSGKSAIIPIVDYCLCSSKCRIPVDVIRNTVEWFGILVQKEEKEILICRKEPGRNDENINLMYLKVDNKIVIPNTISDSNCNKDQVKDFLNNELSFSTEKIDPDSNDYSGRPSLRDATSLLYQPQNIIANQNTLFYNTDQPKHRKRFVKLLPYFLRFETVKTIKLRHEIEQLTIDKKRKERELQSINKTSHNWEIDAEALLNEAKEFNLINLNVGVDHLSYKEKLDLLKTIIDNNNLDELSAESIKVRGERKAMLKKQEYEISSELTDLQNKLASITVLDSELEGYAHTLDIQKERLEISSWIYQQCSSSESKYNNLFTKEELKKLCDALKDIEDSSAELKTNPDIFSKERNLIQQRIKEAVSKLNDIKVFLRRDNQHVSYTNDGIGFFFGKLKTKYEFLSAISDGGEFNKEIDIIKEQIQSKTNELRSLLSTNSEDNVLSVINASINKYIKTLDAERPNDYASLDINELSVKIKEDWLWELGSASNFLSYHIATMLSIQSYLQKDNQSVIPNFLIIDQPSQVYFPNDGKFKDDNDKKATYKIFDTLSKFVKENGKCEIIVLEHADKDIWGGLDNIYVSAEWRDGSDKLIPEDWI